MTLIQDVLNAIINGESKAGNISTKLRAKNSSVRGALRRLESRGDIVRTSRGIYRGKKIATLEDGLPLSERQANALSSSSFSDGWYLSGLQYNRDIGITIYGIEDIDKAEGILRDYAERNINNYNPDFYGIGPIPYDGVSRINEIREVNL